MYDISIGSGMMISKPAGYVITPVVSKALVHAGWVVATPQADVSNKAARHLGARNRKREW